MLEAIQNFDAAALLFIQENIRGAFLDAIMVFITHLGDGGAIWIAAGVLMLLFKKTRKAGVFVLLGLLGSLLINNTILKNLFDRTRPYVAMSDLIPLIPAPHGSSFPSGHTASSFVAAFMMGRYIPKYGKYSYILAVLIAVSRCHVGVHYPTDVLFGVLSGILIGVLVSFVFEKVLAALNKKLGKNIL